MMKCQRLFSNIWFWIVLFFIIRLVGITNPPLDSSHNWRQTTVTMVARNYYEKGDPFLYPRIDVAGEKSGITGMEFPLFNYLIFCISKIFGYTHWYGRLINLLISSLGIGYFYKLLKELFSEKRAFIASLILLSSIWFSYSRKIMPDTFAMSLVIIGLYHSIIFLKNGSIIRNYIPALLCITLGILSKLPMACALPVLGIAVLNRNWKSTYIWMLFGGLFFGLISVYWYYYRWVPYLNETFGFHHFFMGKSMKTGAKELLLHWPAVLEKFYLDALHIIGFLFALWGIYSSLRKDANERLLVLISATMIVSFGGIMLLSGTTFAIHSYYMIPFVPIMSLWAAAGIENLPTLKWQYIALAIVMIENVANWQHDLFLRKDYASFEMLETALDRAGAKRTDKILVNSKEVPTPLYFAHRQGWAAHNYDVERTEYIDSLNKKGLKWVINAKAAFGSEATLHLTKVDSNEFFDIYRSNPSKL